MPQLRFLQFSDAHLDAKVETSLLSLPEEKRRLRQREVRDVVRKACALARERNCDVVLIPGDLLDDEAASLDTANFLIDTFASLAPMPVLISPGNHDPFSATSRYHSELLLTRGQSPWPQNVHIFKQPSFEGLRLPRRDDVVVVGISHLRNRGVSERLLAEGLVRPEGDFAILLFHGSREAYLPPGKKLTLPFSDTELLSLGFDYAAIGHYHDHGSILDSEGRIRGAYSGAPAAQRLTDAGPRCVLVGTIGEDKNVHLEKVNLDPRTLHSIEVDCTGLTHTDAVLDKMESAAACARSEDMLYLRLTGRFPPGTRPELPAGFLQDKCFHVKIDTRNVLPGYDLDAYVREPSKMETVEGTFVRYLKDRLSEETDPEKRRIIENAIWYGLDAMIQKEVSPRYEDIEV